KVLSIPKGELERGHNGSCELSQNKLIRIQTPEEFSNFLRARMNPCESSWPRLGHWRVWGRSLGIGVVPNNAAQTLVREIYSPVKLTTVELIVPNRFQLGNVSACGALEYPSYAHAFTVRPWAHLLRGSSLTAWPKCVNRRGNMLRAYAKCLR